MITQEWQEKSLEELTVRISSGISRPFYDAPVGLPVLRSNNVKHGMVNTKKLKYWHNVDPRGANLELVKPQYNDLLVNFVNGSSSELGKAGLYKGQPKNCIVSTNFFIVRFIEGEYDPEFANLFFQGYNYKKWLYTVAGFSGQGSFNQSDFKKLLLPAPQLEVQKEIVRIVDIWNQKISLTEQLIFAKHSQRKGLMQKLFSGKKRFSEFNSEWKEVQLKNIVEQVHRPVKKPTTRYRALGIRCHCKGSFEKYIDDPASIAMEELYIAQEGDLIVNITFAWEGAVAIVPKEHDGGLVSHRFPMYRPIEEKIDLDFLRYVIIQPRFKYLLGVISPGGAGRNRVLSKKDFLSLKILLPHIDEQRKIGAVLRTIDKDIELLDMQLDGLKKQKKGLIQQLLTGKTQINFTEAA